MTPPPLLQHATAGVLDIAYLEHGPADGPPVFLMHGFPYDVHAYAEVDHGDAADYLLRQVAITGMQQHRIRKAITHVFTLRNNRAVALNRWLDEPGALR